MIVYLANKTQFRGDILSNRIEKIVHESFQRQMDTVLEDAEIPHNAGVAIEFNIPQTGKRVDFIVSGARAALLEAARFASAPPILVLVA